MGIYEDVALLQEQMTEVQNNMVVNFVDGQEVQTNKKSNGKVVYCKQINIGALPNATSKDVATGLNMSSIEIVHIEGIATNDLGVTIPLPNATHSTSYLIGCFVTSTGLIRIGTAIDRSDYTGTVRIYYVYK